MSVLESTHVLSVYVFLENKVFEERETKPKNNLKKRSHSGQHLRMHSILSINLKCLLKYI